MNGRRQRHGGVAGKLDAQRRAAVGGQFLDHHCRQVARFLGRGRLGRLRRGGHVIGMHETAVDLHRAVMADAQAGPGARHVIGGIAFRRVVVGQ